MIRNILKYLLIANLAYWVLNLLTVYQVHVLFALLIGIETKSDLVVFVILTVASTLIALISSDKQFKQLLKKKMVK